MLVHQRVDAFSHRETKKGDAFWTQCIQIHRLWHHHCWTKEMLRRWGLDPLNSPIFAKLSYRLIGLLRIDQLHFRNRKPPFSSREIHPEFCTFRSSRWRRGHPQIRAARNFRYRSKVGAQVLPKQKCYPLVNVYKKQWKDPPFLMGKSTISMAMFNCYVSSPEGKWVASGKQCVSNLEFPLVNMACPIKKAIFRRNLGRVSEGFSDGFHGFPIHMGFPDSYVTGDREKKKGKRGPYPPVVWCMVWPRPKVVAGKRLGCRDL